MERRRDQKRKSKNKKKRDQDIYKSHHPYLPKQTLPLPLRPLLLLRLLLALTFAPLLAAFRLTLLDPTQRQMRADPLRRPRRHGAQSVAGDEGGVGACWETLARVETWCGGWAVQGGARGSRGG